MMFSQTLPLTGENGEGGPAAFPLRNAGWAGTVVHD